MAKLYMLAGTRKALRSFSFMPLVLLIVLLLLLPLLLLLLLSVFRTLRTHLAKAIARFAHTKQLERP